MKFFLDSALIDEVRYALDTLPIDGITTNPRHIQSAGKPFAVVLRELAALVAGSEKTVSVEVNPHLTEYADLVKAAQELAALSPNFVIKLPCTEAALKAIPTLAKQGIRVNMTLVFSPVQALFAMRAGAYYVSPFIGWKEANGEEITEFIQEVVSIKENYNFSSQVIVAAVRHGRQIVNAALAGADIVTAALAVYREALSHPYTAEGLQRFRAFWDQIPTS